MSKKHVLEEQLIVIFGASGDLTARKLIPSIYNLYCKDYLPPNYAILGVGRSSYSDEAFREKVVFENEHLKAGDDTLQGFSELVHYEAIDTSNAEDYKRLAERIETIQSKIGAKPNVIFYLSVPPSLYPVIPKHLASVGLNSESDGWKRLIVEKPFGYDLSSAQELNSSLMQDYEEHQIYRIDHYLGKETVQNLLVTRFSNSIFEPLWNRNYVHRIEITSAESVGVESRGGYYDDSGAMRDMLQNHLLQLIAIVAMEPPVNMEADSIRNEKLRVFQSIRNMSDEDIRKNVIRGQYLKSVINGEEVRGYREEKGVKPESKTETFVAMKFFIDNWRWSDVPFYIRTGKKLPTRVSEIVIHFKPNHHRIFKDTPEVNSQNILVIRIQPDEGILVKVGIKVPGAGFKVNTVNMDFLYSELADAYVPDAYERLLLDCMQGDATLFARGDSVEAAWKFVDPILQKWKEDPTIPIYGYPAGTWGPEGVDALIEGENMEWRYPCKNLADDGIYCEL
ncbi:MAG: glucose-6-phosphate dehydrogenase [Bacteroidota bacterium]